MITQQQITVGSKFKTEQGLTWVIDKVENDIVETSMQNGAKGNYRNAREVVKFLNEEGAVKIKSFSVVRNARKDYDAFVEINYHNEAAIILAVLLDDEDALSILRDCERLQNSLGYLIPEVKERRSIISRSLFNNFKRIYNIEWNQVKSMTNNVFIFLHSK